LKLNLACKRFKRLWNEQDERSLTRRESRFLDAHRCACQECQGFEASTASALGMLRMASMDAQVSPGFDDRVLRRAKVQTVRQSLKYWSPAFVGGAIACIALVAALQIAATPSQLKSATLPEGEARLGPNPDHPMPKLILSSKPNLGR
jgi:hypothetical protein